MKLTNVIVIYISKLKLDNSVLTLEFQIDENDLLCFDRNRHGGRFSYYTRNDLSYNIRSYFIAFFEISLPNSKPIMLGTIYRHPN